MSTNRKRAARALNRLAGVCLDEQLALEPAADHMGGERAVGLQGQAARRSAFVRDLSAAVVALGGVPRRGASYRARLFAAFRSLRELAVGTNRGDDYAACARASARSAQRYAKTLRLDLADDVRFGVERQYAEVDFDSTDLRRMRWGATSNRNPGTVGDAKTNARAPRAPTELRTSALDGWADDGGRAAT